MRQLGLLFVLFGVLILGLNACASSEPEYIAEAPAPAGEALTLEIEPHHNGWAIHTNRPVSVALFEIWPNRGVGLLFPDPAREDGRLQAGMTRLSTTTGRVILRHRAAYLSPRGTGGLVGNTNLRLNQANAPITVVAVACECTLALEELAEPGGPQDVLGPFAGLSTPTAVRGLVEAILPSPEANWISTRYIQGVDGG